MHSDTLASATLLLVAAVLAVALFRRINLPPILAYLFVGLTIGPHALGWFDAAEETYLLGEIGIAFLLFAIGLEFSLPQFWSMRQTLLGLGGAQVLIGTISGALIAWLTGIPWGAALVVGGALAMSSTAIVVKQLTDQVELQLPHGRLALGILLFQDLAAVPFLVVIPILASSTEQSLATPLLLALLKTALAFAILLTAGRYLLRPLFHEVAAARSAELFTLTVLLVSLVAAWLTHALGLSLALGAFLAGMMLSETEYRHQIETDIRPFRDVLLGLFFVMVGMQLNLDLLPSLWPWTTLLVLGLVLGKGALIFVLTKLLGHPTKTAIRTGLVLAHGGEFGFALLALALQTGLLSSQAIQPILVAAVISMLIAPILVRHSNTLAQKFCSDKKVINSAQAEGIAQALQSTGDHVIICGFGRVGRNMAGFLRDEDLAYVGLDLDPLRVKEAWDDGQAVYYGDAARRDILLAAGLARARALVISFDDAHKTLNILQVARSLRKDIPILVRARDDANLHQFLRAGATEVVPETLEASLMLATQLLLLLDIPAEKIADCTRAVRRNRYLLINEKIY